MVCEEVINKIILVLKNVPVTQLDDVFKQELEYILVKGATT